MIPGEEKEEEVVPYNSGDVEDSMTNNPTVCYSSSWTGLQGAGKRQDYDYDRLPAGKVIGIVPQGTGSRFQCRILNVRGRTNSRIQYIGKSHAKTQS